MRRKIDICRKCSKFYESLTDFGYYCDEYMPMEYTKPLPPLEFVEMSVPSGCRMRAEYCIEEWNDEKKD